MIIFKRRINKTMRPIRFAVVFVGLIFAVITFATSCSDNDKRIAELEEKIVELESEKDVRPTAVPTKGASTVAPHESDGKLHVLEIRCRRAGEDIEIREIVGGLTNVSGRAVGIIGIHATYRDRDGVVLLRSTGFIMGLANGETGAFRIPDTFSYQMAKRLNSCHIYFSEDGRLINENNVTIQTWRNGSPKFTYEH